MHAGHSFWPSGWALSAMSLLPRFLLYTVQTSLHLPSACVGWLQATADAPSGNTAADLVGSSLMQQLQQPLQSEDQANPVDAAARMYHGAAAGGCRLQIFCCSIRCSGDLLAARFM